MVEMKIVFMKSYQVVRCNFYCI